MRVPTTLVDCRVDRTAFDYQVRLNLTGLDPGTGPTWHPYSTCSARPSKPSRSAAKSLIVCNSCSRSSRLASPDPRCGHGSPSNPTASVREFEAGQLEMSEGPHTVRGVPAVQSLPRQAGGAGPVASGQPR